MNDTERLSKRADAMINHSRLREAALAVFAQAGLDLEVNDIATRAQVGVATLYRHFGSREELLRAIVTEIAEDALTQFRLAVQRYPDDPRTALQALVSAGLRLAQQYQPLFALLYDPRLTKLFEAAQRETTRGQLLDQVAGVIERGIQAGIFREDLEPELVAATIFGSFTSVTEHLGKRFPLAVLEQQLAHLLWMMVAKEGSQAFLSGSSLQEPATGDR